MAAKENFITAHWDWFVALAGLAVFGVAAVALVPELGQSADAAAEACEAQLNAVRPDHDGVPEADLGVLLQAFNDVSSPRLLKDVDPKKANFLASERRLACQADEGQDAKKACGKPIPAEAEVCPRCGMKQPARVKVEIDSDRDGMPNDWEIQYGFNKDDPSDAARDADGDGFTNLEEYQAGTDPRDAKSHPDYFEFMSVAGALKQTFLKFYFKQANPMPGGTYRLTFQRLDTKSKYDNTFTARIGEEIKTPDGKTSAGWSAAAYNLKDVEVPAYKGSKMMKKIKVGFVDVVRKDGKKLTIRENDRRVPVETQVDVQFARDGGKTFSVSEGSVFAIREKKYRVLKLESKNNQPVVTLEDVATKKQNVLQ